ncbi:MAG: transcription elongation factor GreB [Alphaproteobacteria bacterium]|nr:transcription elongation factor GreB [Alphaproteobacteria bacterium]
MSKAFTKENDDAEEEPASDRAAPAAAVRNLITPAGLDRLRTELNDLRRVERPKVVETVAWAASNGDRSENGDYIYGKRRLRQIDARIHFLGERLKIAEPVDPAKQKNRDQVFFGATVTYADDGGKTGTVRIVGIDEAGAGEDVSWISPIARALMRARVGDTVRIETPAGARSITVQSIRYPD